MPPFSPTVAHPWHGISAGEKSPDVVNVFVEIVPTDTVKYEIDKATGYLKLDRPQKFSNLCPSLYGFIPQTICLDHVATYAMEKTGLKNISGDGDPIDICVFTERAINHANILLQARPIGGFRMFDGGEADDKIIAILMSDAAFEAYNDITEVPKGLIDRLKHYFLTYKQIPNWVKKEQPACVISDIYGRDEALEVIRRSMADYDVFIKQQKTKA